MLWNKSYMKSSHYETNTFNQPIYQIDYFNILRDQFKDICYNYSIHIKIIISHIKIISYLR